MAKAYLLGISQDSIAVIFDLIFEIKNKSHFLIYPNIETNIIPLTPHKKINYEIMPLDKEIDKTKLVFFGLASPKNKISVFSYFLKKNEIEKTQYDKIIHPSAYISSSSLLDNGVLIEPNVVISSQSKIGFGVFIKRGSLIGHHNNIGDFTDINPGVTISGKVTIGKCCTIGSGTVIKDNITIGKNTIIGIGSVVTKDIPENSIAYGNPCKVVKENTIHQIT
jgi:sugar O-acyltransferase (sialic acid O-acetyltransferase NeuD family)